jgi:hypothetical protein
MKKFTLQIFMIACMLFTAGFSYGQAKPEDYPTIGQSYVKSVETQSGVFTIDFNTTAPTSTWTQDEDTTIFSWGKARTGRGFAVTVWDGEGNSLNPNEDFKVRSGRFRSNENPNHVASVDSMQALLAKWEEVHAGTDNAEKNTLNAHSVCVFDVDGDTANQAYGVHPGIYKKVEAEFVFRWADMTLKSDFQFTIDTYDAGNTNETATYSLRVKFSSIDTTVVDFYETGSGLKQVNLAEATGLDISDFNGQSEVHVYLATEGTNTPIAEGVYDPVIVVDDMTVTFALPVWVEPAAGVDTPGIPFTNEDDPLVGPIGEETTLGIALKTEGRLADLTIVDNLYLNGQGDKVNKKLTFAETGAVKANDGSGNYTVDVDYTLEPAILDAGTMQWTNQKITIPAPAEGSVDDDLMLYFDATPLEDAYSARLELNNGNRIFYDVFIEGAAAPIVQEWNISDSDFNALGEVTESTTINGLTVYATSDKKITVDENSKSIDGMDFTSRLKLGGSGTFTEGTPESRILAFDVTGNSTITVAAMSSSSSSDRELTIAAGTSDNVIGTFPALGASIGKQEFEYTGGPTTIYIFSPSSGVNVYYIKAVTAAPEAAKKVAYLNSNEKVMAETATQLDNDPIIQMLMADPNIELDVILAPTDTASLDLSGYDAVVVQEGWSSSGAIYNPGAPLGLASIPVPFVYNKVYAMKAGRGFADGAAGSGGEEEGTLSIKVEEANQTNELFNGITFDAGVAQLFNTGADDDGSDGRNKGLQYATDVVISAENTLLASGVNDPENATVCINDIPAGATVGSETLQARMISIPNNTGAINKDNGTNLTSAGLTLWRNAVYSAAGLTVPTTPVEAFEVPVSTLATLSASVGEMTPDFDPSVTTYQLVLPKGTAAVTLSATATDAEATVTVPGETAVTEGNDISLDVVVVNSSESDTTTYTVNVHLIATAVNQLDESASVRVYPNPASDYARVNFSADRNGSALFTLYSITGRQVLEANKSFTKGINEMTISTSDFSEGLYIYKLKIDDKVSTGKLNIVK